MDLPEKYHIYQDSQGGPPYLVKAMRPYQPGEQLPDDVKVYESVRPLEEDDMVGRNRDHPEWGGSITAREHFEERFFQDNLGPARKVNQYVEENFPDQCPWVKEESAG